MLRIFISAMIYLALGLRLCCVIGKSKPVLGLSLVDRELPDNSQNFWHLACIQASAFGIPGWVIGKWLANTYGVGTAILSLIIGNLFLWIVGLATVMMADRGREHAVENVKDYLGKWGSLIAAFVLLIAFLIWFTIELEVFTSVGVKLLDSNRSDLSLELRVGTVLGLIVTLLSLGGIRWIRWICVLFFPIQVIFLGYAIFVSPEPVSFAGPWHLSLAPTLVVITNYLPGIVNLPTFFRHSRSRAHSILALALILSLTALIEASSIWIGVDPTPGGEAVSTAVLGSSDFYIAATSIFLLVSFLCSNLINIYFASVGWETIVPVVSGKKEYAIMGLIGTAAFTLVQASEVLVIIEQIASSLIACLGVVLVGAFLVRIVVRHRPREFEKSISFFCWIVGSCVSILALAGAIDSKGPPMAVGASMSLVAFLIFIFFEEMVWAIQHLRSGGWSRHSES